MKNCICQKHHRTKFLAIVCLMIGLLLMPFSYLSWQSSQVMGANDTNGKLNDLYQKKNSATKEISDKTKAAQEKKKQAEALAKTINKIDGDISEIEGKITSLQGQISQTQSELEVTQQQIANKQTELNAQVANKHETLREIYEAGNPDTIELLIGSNTLSEAIDHNQYFEILENKIEATIDQITSLKEELEAKKQELDKKNEELKKLKSQQEGYKLGLENQKKEKDVVLKNTKTEQKTLEEQVQEAQKYSQQVEAQIANLQASLNQSSSRVLLARDRGTSSVGFAWPTDYKYISAYFGDRTPFQVSHSGIDLVNVQGTPIYAAANGTVVTAADMMIDGHYYGYGKYVVIGHNARFNSLYGHLVAYTVSVGDEVKQGDIIGYLGTTGWSTGPHLHFEIWDNGARQNPLNYLP